MRKDDILFAFKFWLAGVVLGLIILLVNSTKCSALENRVRIACTGDYFEYCSNTVPGSEECKQCFRGVGRKLSRVCLNALRSSSEFSNDYRETRKRYVSH